MDFIKELKKRRWQMSMIALLTLGLITNGYGTALAETMADISGGSVAADGSWHGDGKVKITAGSSFTNDADIYSSKDYCAGMQLKMDGGQICGSIYGGWSDNPNYKVYSNMVEITAGKISGNVYGGWSKSNEASGNLVEIGNGVSVVYNTRGNVYGGYSAEYKAGNNIVNCYDKILGNIYGGYGKLSADGNKLSLGNGCRVQCAYGGYSETGNANKNELTIYDGVRLDEVYGGAGKNANNNVVNLENVYAESNVSYYAPILLAGGFASDASKGTANYNKVTLINTNGNISVVGGKSLDNSIIHSANYNEVTIENCRINSAVAANLADETNYNKLNITNSIFKSEFEGVSCVKNACSNILTVDGLSFDNADNEKIIGVGTIEGQKINNNAMYINNAKAYVIYLVKKISDYNLSYRLGLSAEGNKAIVTNSSISYLHGLFGEKGASSDSKGDIFANNNEVTISNSNIEKYIGLITPMLDCTGGFVKNNTLRLIGKDGRYGDLTGGPINIGGKVEGVVPRNGLETQNNNLEIYGKNIKLNNIFYFDNINFYLADNAKNKDVVVTGSTSDNMDLSKTMVSVTGGQSKLSVGDKITLIKLSNNNAELLFNGSENNVLSNGPFEVLGYKLAVDKAEDSLAANDLIMTVTDSVSDNGGGAYGPDNDPNGLCEESLTNMKNIAETRANAAALVDEGMDFLADKAIGQAKSAAKSNASAGEGGFAPFAVFGGSDMRYKTGSHIDSKSWHGAIGMAKQVDKLTFGLAIDYGRSRYDSYMDNGTHGNGKSKAFGGTLFAERIKENGNYFDAAFQGGILKNDYSAILSGFPTQYDERSNYYGLSLGYGRKAKSGNHDMIDMYGRLFYSHLCSNDTYVNDGIGGTEAHFDGVDSTRLRLGARNIHCINEHNSLYAGLAWQYEFSGKARATIGDNDAPAPSLKGHSGMAELGYKIETDKDLSFDFNVNGWFGKKKGVAGGVSLQWCFR